MTVSNDVAAIAGKLTEAQQEAFLGGKWNIYPGIRRFMDLGLVEKPRSQPSRLTPLGLAVREHLREHKL
jgi:hypothetical protein